MPSKKIAGTLLHFYITLNMVKLFFRSFCNTRSLTFIWPFFAFPVELGMTNPLGSFLDVSRYSSECSSLRQLVFKKTLSTAQYVLGHSGFEGVCGTEVVRVPFRGCESLRKQ